MGARPGAGVHITVNVFHRLKGDPGGKPGVWGPQWGPGAGPWHSNQSSAWMLGKNWAPAANLDVQYGCSLCRRAAGVLITETSAQG